MRSWSSLLARVSMKGRDDEDDALVGGFIEDVIKPGHFVISYDPRNESVVVLSADASHHLRGLLEEHGCYYCLRVASQLEVQEIRHEPDEQSSGA